MDAMQYTAKDKHLTLLQAQESTTSLWLGATCGFFATATLLGTQRRGQVLGTPRSFLGERARHRGQPRQQVPAWRALHHPPLLRHRSGHSPDFGGRWRSRHRRCGIWPPQNTRTGTWWLFQRDRDSFRIKQQFSCGFFAVVRLLLCTQTNT